MTALDIERMTDFAGVVPTRGTFKIKANVRIFKGALVGTDSAGRAMPGDTIANGCLQMVGKASATYDNRTGSDLGGDADACDVEVEYGVFDAEFKTGGGDDIDAGDVGSVCFIVDDHTVALTNNTDTRAIAGLITEFRDGRPFVWMGPHVAALLIVAASEASQLDTAQTDIDALELRADALELDAATSNASFGVPLFSLLDPDGDPLAKFTAGNTGVPGFSLTDSKAVCLRWNNYPGNPGVTVIGECSIPKDLDPAEDMILEFLCSKTGATAGDATKLTVAAYFLSAGDLHDADTDCGGDTDALVGNATAKTTKLLTLTLAAADVPAGAVKLSFTLTPKSGLIETDDFILHAMRVRYTRKIQTS